MKLKKLLTTSAIALLVGVAIFLVIEIGQGIALPSNWWGLSGFLWGMLTAELANRMDLWS